MQDSENNRILVVDDNPAIHMDFRRILETPRSSSLDRATAELFGDDLSDRSDATYDLTFVNQGDSAVDAVARATAMQKPFALAFVDMRMPPGIDGLEALARMWQIDANIEAVICTAYSDRTWEAMVQKLGRTDQFLVLKKPFEPEEVCQIASSLTCKWSRKRQRQLQIQNLERLIRDRKEQLPPGTSTATPKLPAA